MRDESAEGYLVRNTTSEDFDSVVKLTHEVYPNSPAWSANQLASHRNVFPEGQFVAVETATGRVVGMAASLIVWWDDYDKHMDWREFTEHGSFSNHDPENGRTLYGAEVMVHPSFQGRGIGKMLYRARRALVLRLGLLRIRAGARLRGYHRHADQMTAEEYVIRVVRGELGDPTLSFQLKRGFDVLGVVANYLRHDPESLGWAALIEWLNPSVATPSDYAGRDPRFARPSAAGTPRGRV